MIIFKDEERITTNNSVDEYRESPQVREFIQQLMAQKETDLIKTAQKTITQVECGLAGEIGLEFTACLEAIIEQMIYKRLNGKTTKYSIEQAVKLSKLAIKLTQLHKQSAAWNFRAQNVVKKDDGLGRNDKRIAERILRRGGTTTAEGMWEESL